jgi:hypothetical protein
MLNQNLIPVYYNENTGEFVADFSSRPSSYTRELTKAQKQMRGKNSSQRRQALDVRNNVDSATLTAPSSNTQINAARQRRLAEEAARNRTQYSSPINKMKDVVTRTNTPKVRGMLSRATDALIGTTTAGKITRGLGAVGLGAAGYGGYKVMQNRKKAAQDRRYGGLGRYMR